MAYDPEQPVFEQEIQMLTKPILTIDEKPKSFFETFYYALQLTLVDFSPFIWATAFVAMAGLPESVTPSMISYCFIGVFVATMIQTTLGNRLPVVQLPSVPIFVNMASIAKTYPFGLTTAWGAAFAGGIIEGVFGASRVLTVLRKFMPPVVVGSVVATIGFVITRISLSWVFAITDSLHLTLGIVSFLLALFLRFKLKGLISRGFVLISILIVGIFGGTLLGVFDWGSVARASWIALPKLFPFKGYDGASSPMIFSFSAILLILTGYACSIFESIGDYAAICTAATEPYKVKHMNRGIAAEGFACALCSLFGGLPVTSASQNAGIIASTGIASRVVTQTAAFIFLLYGLSPKLTTILAAIPKSVIGGAFIISAGLILLSGINTVMSDIKDNFGNMIVAGVTLGVSVMMPYYLNLERSAWLGTLRPFTKLYLTNNVFLAVTVGIVSNLLINYVFYSKEQ
ncbi:uracil-xanthine permease family protein [Acetomicrobium sp.]|uniref:uracil-xanthine permease family protein n=1 Tax=Acetomicrobium sp. TaxID=1872099 RepID=UPI002B25F0DF|nr:solute carrier family 23 protein [Acetomicrobium sp.]